MRRLGEGMRLCVGSCAGLLLALPSVAQETAKPVTGGDPVGPAGILQIVLALGLVIGLILATGWLLRRLGRFSVADSGAIRIIAALALGQRERLVLVQLGEKQLLLGIAPGQIRTLHVLEKPIETPATSGGDSFAARLRQAARGEWPR